MLSLFIIKTNSPATRYGIGTYLKQLTGVLLENEDVNIYIINFQSDKYKEFVTISAIPKFMEIYIPKVVVYLKYEKQKQKYAERVVDFLIPFLNNCPNPVFLVNSSDGLPLVKQLKTRFLSKVISVIHTAYWQLAFNGNKKQFLDLWTNKKGSDSQILKSVEAEKELYEISDKVVSVTKYMKIFIMNYFNIPEEKIKVIPNGIDKSLFILLDEREKKSIKQSLGFYKDEKIILYSGRLDRGKGIFFLIDAFAQVCKQYNEVRLVLVGEDSGQDSISQYLAYCTNIWGKVTFTGFVEEEVMKKFLWIADIGILPSIYDHCPYVALEMIGNNVPLIISNTEGLNEILSSNQCIYLNPSTDEAGNIIFDRNEIVDAILTLLRFEKSRTINLTADYQDLIKTKFSRGRMGKEMYSVLLNLQSNKVGI